jgi:hypothetical protein
MRVNLCIFPGLSFLWHANAHFILDSAIEKEFSERVSPRATQKDPEDLSHIKNWTALGDSFVSANDLYFFTRNKKELTII